MPRQLIGHDGITSATGDHLGYSPTTTIAQQHLDDFVRAIGMPFPDAAGYFALSLSNLFLPQIVDVQGFDMGVNYGCDKVTFDAEIHAGDSVRAGAVLVSTTPVTGGVQTLMLITVEIVHASGNKTACTIESLSRWY